MLKIDVKKFRKFLKKEKNEEFKYFVNDCMNDFLHGSMRPEDQKMNSIFFLKDIGLLKEIEE